MQKVIDIKTKYSHELSDIKYILDNLEKGRYLENSRAQSDGSLAHNIQKLRRQITELLLKIEYGKDSISDELAEVFNTYSL